MFEFKASTYTDTHASDSKCIHNKIRDTVVISVNGNNDEKLTFAKKKLNNGQRLY